MGLVPALAPGSIVKAEFGLRQSLDSVDPRLPVMTSRGKALLIAIPKN
jgi:hypothetical protein